MTRVNLVSPDVLWDEHLIAELREIPRIPNAVFSGKIKSQPPSEFKLGQGHVLFFTDKLVWLKKRYNELYLESLKRGFNVIYRFPSVFGHIEWEPSGIDIQLSCDRIAERKPKKPHYYGVKYDAI